MPDLSQMLTAGEISYRQLDYWTRQGYLKPDGDAAPGQGNFRTCPRRELDVAALMLRLTDTGFSVAMAARIARAALRESRNGRVSLRIAAGIVLTITGDPL